MSTTRFAFCFIGRDGKMVCQHHNGSWIVLSGYGQGETKKEEGESQTTTTSEKQ